jgi:prepilin-type N-terminal cleavage/methylation domain-containing protein
MNNKNLLGFTLIELLIVVSVVGIVSAIAIPNLLASRKAAHEAQVVSNLRTIASANAVFYANSGTYAFNLVSLRNAGLIDRTWIGSPTKNGYTYFYYTGNTNQGWCLKAAYGSNLTAGTNSYTVSHLGTIYKLPTGGPPDCDAVTGIISTGSPL